jgi:signal transduction histidine kinase
MPTLLRSRLALRLALLFLLVSLAPIVGAALLSARAFEEALGRERERRLALLGERAAALVEEHVERARAKLRTVARLVADGQGERPAGLRSTRRERDELVARLQELVDPPDAFLELQFFLGGVQPEILGQVRQQEFELAQNALPDHDERNRAQVLSNMEAPLVQVPLEGDEWRDSKLATIEGYRTLLVSVPVTTSDANGALVAYVDFAPLVPRLAALAGDEYALLVLDAQGTPLAGAGAVAGPAFEHAWSAAGAPWTVRVAESEAPHAAALADFRRQAWLWATLAAAGALAASLGLAAWITRPVARLQRAAERLARGEFDARADLARGDEIGRLGAAFDRMAAALSELDRAKSEFVASVSHELRTPLTSMKLSLANLLDGVVGEVTPAQRTALVRVQGELERLILLVNQLLEMARLEAGAVAPRIEPLELAPLARATAESLAPLAAERGLEVRVEGEATVRADPGMLRRVLLNLLDNAIKFAPAGSVVTVRVGPRGFRVEDRGPGLDPDVAFESFRQGTQHGVKHPGVGLGLAIVKKLVELNAGTVRVERPDAAHGTVMVVELPAA